MGSIGPMELALVALLALLLFGAGRIASVGKGLGQAIREFKEGVRDDSATKDDAARSSGPLSRETKG